MRRPARSWSLSLLAAALACGLATLLPLLFGPALMLSPLLSAYGAVVFSAWFGGRALGFLVTAACVVLETGLLLPPLWTAAGGLDRIVLLRIAGFAGVSAFLTVLISGVVSARNRVARDLERTRDDLEKRVKERTAELSAVIATLQDEIVERQRMAEALRASEEAYHTLADNFPSGAVVLFDRELRLRLAYGVELTDVGLPKEAIQGKTIFEAYPPETCAMVEPAYRAALAGQRSFLEVPLAGRIYEVHVLPIHSEQGGVAAGMVLVQNITSHKRTADELRQRTAELEAVFAAIPDSLFRVRADGTIESHRAALTAGSVAPPFQRPSMHIRDVFPDPAASQLADAVAEVFRTGAGRTVECWVAVGGQEACFETRMWPFPGPQVLVMVRDITERKRVEGAARDSQAELAHVLRVTTMGEMASGLAHELNQPLQAIVNFAKGCTRRIEARTAVARDLVEPLREIAAEALRAGEVIRRLRGLVRKEPPKREPVDLGAVVLEVTHLLEAEAQQQGIGLRVDCGGDPPAVLADRVQIEQVILNLMRNGLEAMAVANGHTRELAIRVSCPDANSVEVAVTDGGEGFTPGMAETIFTPFFTTKAKGIGMGLSISRSIVEAHGGRLSGVSTPGSGSTFRFALPVGGGTTTETHGQQEAR